MSPLLAALLHLAMMPGASSALFAQDAVWSDTQFSRVHLRNGNVIDGSLVRETEKNIHLAIQGAGILIIPKNTIVKLEAVKMRSFVDLPKVYVPKKVVTSETPGQARPAADKMLALAPPELSPAQRGKVAQCLGKFVGAQTDEERGAVVEELAADRSLRPYLASLLMQVNTSTTTLIRAVLEPSFDPGTEPYLRAALDSDNADVVATAITLLGGSGNNDECGAIRRFLDSPNSKIQVAAITALCALEDGESLSPITKRMSSQDDEVRAAATLSALRLGGRLEKLDFVVEALRDALYNAEGKVARDLMVTAARIRRRELIDAIEPFLRSLDLPVRRTAADAFRRLATNPASVPTLLNRLRQEDDAQTRLTLMNTAGLLQVSDAVPVLIDLLRDSETDQARAAGAALEQITKEKFGSDAKRWSTWWDQMHVSH